MDKYLDEHKLTKEVNESMQNIQELSSKVIQSYLNKLKAKKRAEQEKKEPVTEAKIGDKVTVTHGSQKGLIGHVGEIRKGLGGNDHTYTVDYDDNGKRQSVQVKKAHTKVIKEANDELNKKTPSEDDIMKKHGINKTELDHHLAIGIKVEMEHTKNAAVAREIALDHINEKPDYYAKLKKMVEDVNEASNYSSYMKRGSGGMVGKKPNASDMASYGTYNVTVKHSEGEKTYKLKHMKDSRHAQNVAMKIHRKDNPEHKINTASADKLNEETINEVSKKVLGRYIEKAATSMATAAFGQGQSSAKLQPPREQDQKTGMKRMTGIARATSKLTKEVFVPIIVPKMLDKDSTEERDKKRHEFAMKELKKEIDKSKKDVKEEAEQIDELNWKTLSRYAATARVKAMNKNDPKRAQRAKGAQSAHSKLARGDFSEEIEQVDELKKSTMQSYLNKTVDPDLGLPKDTKKPAQRIKGIERASKKVMGKVNEQQFLTIPDTKEKEHKVASQQKMQRARFINKKNSEEHKVHMGVHEATSPVKPHAVSVQLKHPDLEGVTRKIVKINATSPNHAQELVSKHYGSQGFTVHKIDYAKAHKVAPKPSKAEQAKEQEAKDMKKEDSKVKKIAKAVKDAIK